MAPPPVRLARLGEVDLAYIDLPPADPSAHGRPVLLIHGFASTHVVNWVGPSWTGTLTRAGYRVIAFDNRGHGGSTKFHDPAAYHTRLMAEDGRALLDHLEIARTDVMGYSMGARITAFLALAHPDRVRSAVISGLGGRLVETDVGLPPDIAEALEAESLAGLADPIQRMFRAFADQNQADRVALAACIRGSRQHLSIEEARRIAMPVLVPVGTTDTIAGPAAALAAILPNARALDIPGRDHNLAVGDRVHKEGVLAFLAQRDELSPA